MAACISRFSSARVLGAAGAGALSRIAARRSVELGSVDAASAVRRFSGDAGEEPFFGMLDVVSPTEGRAGESVLPLAPCSPAAPRERRGPLGARSKERSHEAQYSHL